MAKVGLLCSGLAAGLVLAEIGARLLLPPPQLVSVGDSRFAERLKGENRSPTRITVADWGAPDIASFYLFTATGPRLRANTTAVMEHHHLTHGRVVLQTNSLGYRNPELGPKTRKRVLFLGDSITLGDYLDEDKTFVRLVETYSRETSTPLETVNAGVGSIGLSNEVAILTETGLATQPDVVVLGFYLNDVETSPGIQVATPPGALRSSWLVQHLFRRVSFLRSRIQKRESSDVPPDRLAGWKAETARAFPPSPHEPAPGEQLHDHAAFNHVVQDMFSDWGSAWSDGAWAHMDPFFTELKRLSIEHHFELRFMVFPVHDQVEADFLEDTPQQRLVGVGARLGVPVLDLLPVLRKAFRDDGFRTLFYDHCHHTVHGNELIARRILQFLQG